MTRRGAVGIHNMFLPDEYRDTLGFVVAFADGTQIQHTGGPATIPDETILLHGRVQGVEEITNDGRQGTFYLPKGRNWKDGEVFEALVGGWARVKRKDIIQNEFVQIRKMNIEATLSSVRFEHEHEEAEQIMNLLGAGSVIKSDSEDIIKREFKTIKNRSALDSSVFGKD